MQPMVDLWRWHDEIPIPPNAILEHNLHPVDPNFAPWVPSPELPAVDLPGASEQHADSATEHTGLGAPQPPSRDRAPPAAKPEGASSTPPARRSRLSPRFWLAKLRSTLPWRPRPAAGSCSPAGDSPAEDSPAEDSPAEDKRPRPAPAPEPPAPRQVTPAEWKAYGHWARPRIGDVVVRNATPPPFRRHLAPAHVEAVMRSLQSPDGALHPENWIARLEHRAPAAPRRLNPLLAHTRTGPPPLEYDVRMQDAVVCVGPPHVTLDARGAPVGLLPSVLAPAGPNGAQPATHPGVGALAVTALADEPAGFAWPFVVLARHAALPVTVGDVLEALHANFQECLAAGEVAGVSTARREALFRAYWARVEWYPDDAIPGLRRVDFLGDRYMFRGLEPAPDGDGFMMYFGPQR
ncbi:hypothetical protein PsYK624_014470 [Phanerochaete sordida]|uniref:DUF6699 domain-containing protein n=1 Tax=Phanerochaete sordida TaxID=48140 RepID=A0A9P3FY60_9APHY|nr:hypothetical protein PsYK624_014470 [Phanerochaete sordida]